MTPSPAAPNALAELRVARLALARARVCAAEARRQSEQLRARAASASRAAEAGRELVESQRQLWEAWHRGWEVLRTATAAVGARRLLRVCAYCGAALLPGTGASEADWRPVPPPVRDLWRDGTLGLLPSHGACPACAAARLGE